MALLDDRTKILITAGLFRTIDLFFAAAFVLEGITVFFWRVFSSPSAVQLAVVLLASVFTAQLWMILVCFRVGEQVLRARADINLMPDAAARLAILAQRGISQPAAPAPAQK